MIKQRIQIRLTWTTLDFIQFFWGTTHRDRSIHIGRACVYSLQDFLKYYGITEIRIRMRPRCVLTKPRFTIFIQFNPNLHKCVKWDLQVSFRWTNYRQNNASKLIQARKRLQIDHECHHTVCIEHGIGLKHHKGGKLGPKFSLAHFHCQEKQLSWIK